MVSPQFTRNSVVSEGKDISIFTSSLTGLTCINVDLDLPTVSGYFTLATECLNDTGSPHTLEHLVFLGSNRYPYKGVLDSLANRSFAQGTNAWTETDHTAYTIETVGQEGFLNLLPIFVDHILYPTLTESGCYTEVHHINGKGEDAGVVYSEMQGIENTGPALMALRAQRLIHDEQSGYRSETGGLLAEVRKLSVDEIRRYHSSYYVPQNLVLLVTGRVEEARLLHTLEEVDRNILSHGEIDRTYWRRPWIDSSPKFSLDKSCREYMYFPEEDESMGDICVNWPGPSCTSYIDVCALDVLGQYLSHTAISPLQAALVELEEPLCTDIEFYVSDRLRSVISLSLSSVPTELLADVEDKLFAQLNSISQENMDMTRMYALIDKNKLKVKNAVESDPHSAFATPIITDFLYGTRDGNSLRESLDDIKYLDLVKSWTADKWQLFMRKWLIENPHVTILGQPSAAMSKVTQSNEEARIHAQADRLGSAGLKELEVKLKHAQDTNDAPIPSEIIENFPIPSIDGINYIRPNTAQTGLGATPKDNTIQTLIDKDSFDVPFFIQYDDVQPSDFVSISIYIVCSTISQELKPYLSVYLHSMFLNPIERSGVEITYEEVVEQLERDTISYSASFGAGGGFNELIRIKLKVESQKYACGVTWLSELLYASIFDADRIGVAIAKIQNDLPSFKRDGDTVATSVLGVLQLDSQKSVARAANLLDQTKFLDMLEAQLDENEDTVLDKFEKLREEVLLLENMRIHITAEVAKLERPVSSWSSFGPVTSSKRSRPRASSLSLASVRLSQDVLTPYAQKPSGYCHIITIPTDSCYAQHFCKGIADFNHPDLPALIVMTNYLNAMEGLLWKYIRGSGLAYGADLRVDPEAGLIYFSIYRSPDSHAAFSKAREIMRELVAGTIDISRVMIDGAKSSIVFDFVSRESTPYAAANQSFINQVMKGQSPEYRRDLLKKVASVGEPEMMAALKKYMMGLFEEDKSNTVVVCGTLKALQLAGAYERSHFKVLASSLETFESELVL